MKREGAGSDLDDDAVAAELVARVWVGADQRGMSGAPSLVLMTVPLTTASKGAPKNGHRSLREQSPVQTRPCASAWIQSMASISGLTHAPLTGSEVLRWGDG